MGSSGTSDNPPREEFTEAFRIGKFPITNQQFAAFVAARPDWRKGVPADDVADVDYLRDWPNGECPPEVYDLPVAWVPWAAATAFCEWASEVLGVPITLPSEKQWEKASRGTDGRTFPWGEEIDTSRANYSSSDNPIGRMVDGRRRVGTCSPAGDSPYGCVDMAGNVWEWCTDWTDDYEDERVIRGGGWNFTPDFLRCAFRFGCDPRVSYNYIGFRCVSPSRG